MYFYQLLFYTLYRNVLSLLSTIIFDWYFLLSDFFFLVAFTSNFIQVVSLQRCAYWLPLNLQQIKIVVKSSKSIKMHVKIINNIKKLHWKINILLLSHLLKRKKRKEKKLHIWSFHLQMNLLTYNYQLSPKLYHHTVVFSHGHNLDNTKCLLDSLYWCNQHGTRLDSYHNTIRYHLKSNNETIIKNATENNHYAFS